MEDTQSANSLSGSLSLSRTKGGCLSSKTDLVLHAPRAVKETCSQKILASEAQRAREHKGRPGSVGGLQKKTFPQESCRTNSLSTPKLSAAKTTWHLRPRPRAPKPCCLRTRAPPRWSLPVHGLQAGGVIFGLWVQKQVGGRRNKELLKT